MSRSRPNCKVMRIEPTDEDQRISVTSAIWPRWRSSGLATVVATSWGLSPGSVPWTEMVGKSTCGRGDTGSLKNATIPAAASPKVSKGVATGRRMDGVDGHMVWCNASVRCRAHAMRAAGEAQRQPVEPEIDHRRGEEGKQ